MITASRFITVTMYALPSLAAWVTAWAMMVSTSASVRGTATAHDGTASGPPDDPHATMKAKAHSATRTA